MHLTAESTSEDSSSLVTQADCLTGKLKQAKRRMLRPDVEQTKGGSGEKKRGRSLPPPAQHIF